MRGGGPSPQGWVGEGTSLEISLLIPKICYARLGPPRGRGPARCRQSWFGSPPTARRRARRRPRAVIAGSTRLQFGERQLGERAAQRLCALDDLAGRMMRAAERQAGGAHQPIGEVGRGAEAALRGVAQPLAVGAACRAPCRPSRRGRVRVRRQPRTPAPCLPACPSIGERQALHHRQQCDERPVQPAGLGAHQLGGVGVALLRHDRAAGRERIAQRR